MQGFYSPKMARDATEMRMACTQCQAPLDIKEYLFVQEARDKKHPYLDFLLHKLLSSNLCDAMKIKRKFYRFLLKKVFFFLGG